MVGQVGRERPAVTGQCSFGSSEHVELGEPKIAVHRRERWTELGGSAPCGNGVLITPPVVEEIAQVIGGAGIFGLLRHGGLQNLDLLETRREAVVRRHVSGASNSAAASGSPTRSCNQASV